MPPGWKVTISPFISMASCAEIVFPEWVGMRLEGDKIHNLDKFLIPDVAPNSDSV